MHHDLLVIKGALCNFFFCILTIQTLCICFGPWRTSNIQFWPFKEETLGFPVIDYFCPPHLLNHYYQLCIYTTACYGRDYSPYVNHVALYISSCGFQICISGSETSPCYISVVCRNIQCQRCRVTTGSTRHRCNRGER